MTGDKERRHAASPESKVVGPTPRTDAVDREITCNRDCRLYALDLARQLEREIAVVRGANESLRVSLEAAQRFADEQEDRAERAEREAAEHLMGRAEGNSQASRDAITYLHAVTALTQALTTQQDRAERAEAALRELVRLKDLKEQWTRETEVDRVWISDDACEDYATNKSLAWEAARKVLAQ